MVTRLYPVTPVPAPRQVAKDKFNPSPSVLRYRAYRDELALLRLFIPQPFHHALFLLPITAAAYDREQEARSLTPHTQIPDRDNLEKALLDSAFAQDSMIWNGQTTKLWWRYGAILVSDEPLNVIGIVANPKPFSERIDAVYRKATARGKCVVTMPLSWDVT